MSDPFHKFIVLAFLNQTLVLKIGEKVEEVQDSGLDLQKHTLFVGLLENDSII